MIFFWKRDQRWQGRNWQVRVVGNRIKSAGHASGLACAHETAKRISAAICIGT